MKKMFWLILISLITIFSVGCFTDNITNTKDQFGSLNISGQWPNNNSTNISTSALNGSVHTNAQTITIKMTKEGGAPVITVTIPKGTETTFTKTINAVEIGKWTIVITATDSAGKVLSTITKTVDINATSNSFNAVFGPATYAEMFLPTSFANLMGNYTEFFEVFASLGITKRVITGYFGVSDPSGCYWYWDLVGECISNAGYGTHVYTYNSNGKIVSKSKDGTEDYTLGYNSSSRLSSFTKSNTGTGSSESATTSYNTTGLLSGLTKTSTSSYSGTGYSSSSEGSDILTYEYSNEKLIKSTNNDSYTSNYTSDGTTSTTKYDYRKVIEYTWNENSITKIVTKSYSKNQDTGEYVLNMHLERVFTSSQDGVSIWTETQYDTTSEVKSSEWTLKYEDTNNDGNIDAITRTKTYAYSETISAQEYKITFTYENGKVSKINYYSGTSTEVTATETLTY